MGCTRWITGEGFAETHRKGGADSVEPDAHGEGGEETPPVLLDGAIGNL